ncbi:hypothetical protein BJ508DRAFT_109833 [Ascobolus immersus RN42]|uniref:Uncharacterized protein n=1 Tax=Ascobolus immersus RN42 TaxID=1160509 RepID=A0A3N4IBX4_ASCIM|nr:hypothetical protein BJ508DRAFT_109833 [Ascobolus immersus RN42]
MLRLTTLNVPIRSSASLDCRRRSARMALEAGVMRRRTHPKNMQCKFIKPPQTLFCLIYILSLVQLNMRPIEDYTFRAGLTRPELA